MAGDVEERILDAATAVFLQHGFGSASLERIAEAAGAGKATLYSRYSGKEALFAEVVRRTCERGLGIIYAIPPAETLPERLIAMTQSILTRLLTDEVLGLIRLVIADALRFPALAKLTHDEGRARAIDAVATAIAQHASVRRPESSQKRRPAQVTPHARALATRILDAVISPMLMRALMGQNLEEIRKDINAHVEQTIALFVTAKALENYL